MEQFCSTGLTVRQRRFGGSHHRQTISEIEIDREAISRYGIRLQTVRDIMVAVGGMPHHDDG
ncbi:MAG: hypothetical protein R3C26_11735 [Calditrichia bacterium]